MNILSVDWDFFFNDLSGFDWGADETKSYMKELIWHTRYYNRNILTGQYAFQLRPDYEKFWSKIKKNNTILKAVISDSHYLITDFLQDDCTIWNFDQHHDAGYKRHDGKLDAGNWALSNKLKHYYLIYPNWRKDHKESPPQRNFQIFYVDSDFLLSEKFDLVFICRSSCWTPSWCDNHWILFLNEFKECFLDAWENRVVNSYAFGPRSFNPDLAQMFKFDKNAIKSDT